MENFIQPVPQVLGADALLPEQNLIVPPPNQFTHELIRAQPYYYDSLASGASPAGEFVTGTQVVLLVHDGGPQCRVADEQGLYVETAYAGLRKL